MKFEYALTGFDVGEGPTYSLAAKKMIDSDGLTKYYAGENLITDTEATADQKVGSFTVGITVKVDVGAGYVTYDSSVSAHKDALALQAGSYNVSLTGSGYLKLLKDAATPYASDAAALAAIKSVTDGNDISPLFTVVIDANGNLSGNEPVKVWYAIGVNSTESQTDAEVATAHTGNTLAISCAKQNG